MNVIRTKTYGSRFHCGLNVTCGTNKMLYERKKKERKEERNKERKKEKEINTKIKKEGNKARNTERKKNKTTYIETRCVRSDQT